MNIQELTDEPPLSPRIAAADPVSLAAQGFCSVIRNRPAGKGARLELAG